MRNFIEKVAENSFENNFKVNIQRLFLREMIFRFIPLWFICKIPIGYEGSHFVCIIAFSSSIHKTRKKSWRVY